MITILNLLLPLAVLAAPMAAVADDDDHRGKKHKREYKEEYWDGNCKVEREMKSNGDYKEERKCKDKRRPKYREEVRYERVEPVREYYVEPEPVREYYVEPAPRPRLQIHIDATSKR